MTMLRTLLGNIIVRGYSPNKDADRADALMALAILDNAEHEDYGDPYGYCCLIPDPEHTPPAATAVDILDALRRIYGPDYGSDLVLPPPPAKTPQEETA